MRLKAKAKINWSLDITGIREDGYHLMDMLMIPSNCCFLTAFHFPRLAIRC